MKRRKARIMAMQILYSIDFNAISVEDALKFYDETPIDSLALEFVNGVKEKEREIDEIISKSLQNYSIERLNLVDKAIIRVATYELLMKTDKRIVINEALDITKEYSDQGDQKAVHFNNRLLENICKTINETK